MEGRLTARKEEECANNIFHKKIISTFKFFRDAVAYISMTVYVTIFIWCVEEEIKLEEIQV